MMKMYRGKSVCEGIAVGRIYVPGKKNISLQCRIGSSSTAEYAGFLEAREKTCRQLEILRAQTADRMGEKEAAIFDVHKMLLSDEDYLKYIENLILGQNVAAEYAVLAAGEYFASVFEGMEDEYMRERAEDIRDVSEQIAQELTGRTEQLPSCEEGIIIVSDNLTPSETLKFDRDRILAFVTVRGSVNSHTAILAGNLNIPALVNTPADLKSIDGCMAVVDGYSGCLYVDPDEETCLQMAERKAAKKAVREELYALRGKESVTAGGRRIGLFANIGDIDGIRLALHNDAEGIGLFRSEFLFLDRERFPAQEEQFEVYKTLAQSMEGRRVVIRTVDMSADKQADYMKLAKEENPAMGYRGIRICLKHPEILKTQLRAVYCAAAYGNLAVMYPMITSLEEVRKIREIAEEVKKELQREGCRIGHVEQGVMIETPAAALISDLLAAEADFFSIGTNDLSQYTMAIDRQNGELNEFYDPYHEAVLRMISMTVENAHRAGIPCGICGELAADERMTERFLEMGVDVLSVMPARILPLRKKIRSLTV